MQTTAISSPDAISRSEPSVPVRKYLWISFVNSLKTALPNFLALIKATFHNIFSLRKRGGEWFKSEYGSIF